MKTLLLAAIIGSVSAVLTALLDHMQYRRKFARRKKAAEFAVRCNGNLIAFEINGHEVEMFRWIE